MQQPPMNVSTGILLMAAGESSRLGQSKQLLNIQGKVLLVKMTEEALKVTSRVVVVLGANFEAHQRVIGHLPVLIVHHTDWKKGMGSSLKAGLRGFGADLPGRIIMMACDQPLLTADHLTKLIKTADEVVKPIVASAYRETLGVPVLFKSEVYDQLRNLGDSEGARKLIMQNITEVAVVNFPGGELDIDTPEDLGKFQR